MVLNQVGGAKLALEHLTNLGARQVALIKGEALSSDTRGRRDSVSWVAAELGIQINSRLAARLEGDPPSSELRYQVTKKLPASGQPFTALFAFNDISVTIEEASNGPRSHSY